MVQLKCQNRAAEITINPSSSALLIKELGNYERDRKKVKNVTHKGNLTLEQIKKISKVLEEKSMSKTFQGTVKQVLGTCLSLGCTVDKQSPKQIIAKINNGEIKVWNWYLFKTLPNTILSLNNLKIFPLKVEKNSWYIRNTLYRYREIIHLYINSIKM